MGYITVCTPVIEKQKREIHQTPLFEVVFKSQENFTREEFFTKLTNEERILL